MENKTGDNNSFMVETSSVIVITSGEIFEKAEQDMMKTYVWPLIFITIFAILGAIGNSIVTYVYWFKWKRNKTRIFVLCLAVLDLVNCVFNMPVEIAVLWQPLSFDLHYLCKISRGCTFVINNTGSLVLVSIAIERYLLVYYPLRSRQLTPRFAKRMCLVAFIIASSASWPSFIFYGSHTLTIQVGKETFIKGKTCLISDEHEVHTGLILIFTTVLFALLIIVFVVLIVLYIAIGRKIYMATCTEFQMNDVQQDSKTKMLRQSIISAITGVTKIDQSIKKPDLNEATRISFSNQSIKQPNLTDAKRISFSEHNPSASSITDTSEVEDSTQVNNGTPKNRGTLTTSPRLSRKFSTVKSKTTRKNTVMMRMVTIAFMLSFTPFLCILVIRYTNPKYYFSLNEPGKIAYNVFLRTYFINSMVNPFIYGFMDLYFRNIVKQLFSRLCCGFCRTRPS